MALGTGTRLLGTQRLSKIMRTLADVREVDNSTPFLARTPLIPAVDEEIMARFDGRVIAADVIADDQKAVVGAHGSVTFETNKIPNIKRGTHITQSMVNLLDRINRGGGLPEDEGIFTDHINTQLDMLLWGVRHRMEHMVVGMALNSYTYSNLGVNFNVTFGQPSDLRDTPGTAWSVTATATPIDDIQEMQLTARQKYGKEYDRITMSTADFQELTATDQFKAKAQLYFPVPSDGFPSGSFPVNDLGSLQQIAGRMLGLTIELNDRQFKTQANDGTTSYTRYLPVGKIVLSNSGDDNNGMAYDFANGVVTESTVGAGVGSIIGGFTGPERGPVSYATLADSQLNPPGWNLWGVARGFPRLHDQTAFAVITNP